MNLVGSPPYPMNDVYRWDPTEGIIGVLGVAPAATADFYRRVTALIPARKEERWTALIARCDDADAFIIACTELSSLPAGDWSGRPVVDASDSLARHCVESVRRGATVAK